MQNLVNKTLNLTLVGLNANAYFLMGAFIKQARKENWTQDEINLIITEAKKGDYDHLVAVLNTHCLLKDSK